MGGLLANLPLLQDLVVTVMIAVARSTGLLLITPFLGKGILTGLVRNGVILALTIPVLRLGLETRPADLALDNMFLVLALTLKELMIGVMLGMPVAITSWGIEAAGFFIDNQRGTTMASSLNPATGNQSSPFGIMLGQVYTTWLFVSGGFLSVLAALYESHIVWPIWSFLPSVGPGFAPAIVRLLDAVMMLAFLLAGPTILAMFLTEFGLALVSRFAPQLQVFFMAMPLKSAVAMFVLIVSIAILMTDASHYIPTTPGLIQQLQGLFP